MRTQAWLWSRVLGSTLAACLVACGDDGAGSLDAGSLDAGSLDAGSEDAALTDTAVGRDGRAPEDAGQRPDGSSSEAGLGDAGLDGAPRDGATDASRRDGANPDGSVPDGAPADAGCRQYFLDCDGDGFGRPDRSEVFCGSPPADPACEAALDDPEWVLQGTDCADDDFDRYPENEEDCDGADQDCDVHIDEAPSTEPCG